MPSTSNTRNLDELMKELDDLQDLLLQIRSVFPALDKKMVGHDHFEAAPYYQSLGYHATMKLSEPITPDFIERFNRLGKWNELSPQQAAGYHVGSVLQIR